MESEADQSDYFYVDLPAAHTIEIWLRNIPAGANYHLYLYDQNQRLIGNSAEPGNSDEHILTPIHPPGRYYVRVFRSSGYSSTQAYSLRVVFR